MNRAFLQLVTLFSHNTFHLITAHTATAGGGSASHHNLKGSNGDEYVYITYMSASYGDTDTARAGNTGPYNWPWTAPGAPIAYFGDRTDSANTVSGSGSAGTTYDSTFSAGGECTPLSTTIQ